MCSQDILAAISTPGQGRYLDSADLAASSASRSMRRRSTTSPSASLRALPHSRQRHEHGAVTKLLCATASAARSTNTPQDKAIRQPGCNSRSTGRLFHRPHALRYGNCLGSPLLGLAITAQALQVSQGSLQVSLEPLDELQQPVVLTLLLLQLVTQVGGPLAAARQQCQGQQMALPDASHNAAAGWIQSNNPTTQGTGTSCLL